MAKDLKAKIKQWLFDPALFVEEAIRPPKTADVPTGITKQQRTALDAWGQIIKAKLKRASGAALLPDDQAVVDKLGLSIQSGQGTGKDATAGWIILHALTTMPFPKILCTAPSGPQLDAVLWPEVHKWLRQSVLGEVIVHQAEKVYMKDQQGKEWFAVKRTIQKSADADLQAETLAGFHEDFLIYVCDEASGIPYPVFRPIEGSMTGKCNLALILFNPTKQSGYAIDTQTRDRERWVCLHWSSEDSELVPKHLLEADRKKYGRESNFYRIRRLGLPPKTEDDALIPLEWILNCVGLELEPDEADLRVAGLDVSGQGSDKTVMVIGRGGVVEDILTVEKHRTDEIAFWAHGICQEREIDVLAVDVIGLGAGVCDQLENIAINVTVIGVHAGEEAEWEPDRFMRKRDELWWTVREEIEHARLSLPDDDELIGELSVPKYTEFSGSNRKIKVEGKDELRKRGISSPDKADALCLREYARRLCGRRRPVMRQREREEAVSWKVL